MGRLHRGPVTLTPVAERLVVEQPLNLFFTTSVYRGQDLKTQPSTCERSNCATTTALQIRIYTWQIIFITS